MILLANMAKGLSGVKLQDYQNDWSVIYGRYLA